MGWGRTLNGYDASVKEEAEPVPRWDQECTHGPLGAAPPPTCWTPGGGEESRMTHLRLGVLLGCAQWAPLVT